MTKAVTAAAIGSLVKEKNASWETLVKDALPAFKTNDANLQNCITITDLLCHCTGRQPLHRHRKQRPHQ